MVLLRVWNSAKHGGGGWGHSTLQVGGAPPAGIYISWWPGDLKGTLPGFAENKSLADDLRLEGHPSGTFQLDGLDERAMKTWWMRWRGSSTMYMAEGKNCSTTVAEALRAGGSEKFAKMGGWTKPTMWTPYTLSAYARAIRAGQEGIRRIATS
jgi:hypothetical protein